MTITVLFWISMIILIASMVYEPRSYLNALLLMISIGLFMLAGALKSRVYALIFGIFLMLTPLLFIGIAIFLIVNSFTMIKKEGHHLSNLLSLLTGVGMIAAERQPTTGLVPLSVNM